MTKTGLGINILIAVGLLSSTSALAQIQAQQAPQQPQAVGGAQGGAEDEQAELSRKMNEVEVELQKTSEKIEEIEREAQENNPSIEQKRIALMELYREKLDEYGYPDDSELEQLRAIQIELQSPENLDSNEREKLQQDFQQGVEKLQTARDKTQNDSEIQEMQVDFAQERLDTMKDIDPEVEEMQKRLEQLQLELMQLRQDMQMIIQQQHQQR
jgi:chromosome segregation ATPase